MQDPYAPPGAPYEMPPSPPPGGVDQVYAQEKVKGPAMALISAACPGRIAPARPQNSISSPLGIRSLQSSHATCF